MTRARDERLAEQARRALRDSDVAAEWRRREVDGAGERRAAALRALAADAETSSRVRAVAAISALALAAGVLLFVLVRAEPPDLADVLARIDAGVGLTARESQWLEERLPDAGARDLLAAPWDDTVRWEELANVLPDPPRASAPAPVRLLEPRGGIASTTPTFVFDVPESVELGVVELVASLRVAGEETREVVLEAGPGKGEFTPSFEPRLVPGARVAWRVARRSGDRAGIPASFIVRDPEALAAARDAVEGDGPADRVLRAAALLAEGFERAALDELVPLESLDLAPALTARVRYLCAVAHARRGESETFAELRP